MTLRVRGSPVARSREPAPRRVTAGCWQRHAPATYQKLTASVALSNLAPNYDRAIGSVRKSFYSVVLASKAKQRVEI